MKDRLKTGERKATGALAKRAQPKPTPVFDTFWRFAFERQRIYLRRVRGAEMPWTDDPIITKHKFTNAYRAADRVSQFLIQNVIYSSQFSVLDTILRVLLFKIFNKIETWLLLEEALGEVTTNTFAVERCDQLLNESLNQGASIYSAAYIMPSGPAQIRRRKKHRMHLELVDMIFRNGIAKRLAHALTMQDLYKELHEIPSFGPFLSYQFATDLSYSPHFNHSEMEFVVPGPGARDGIRKCFSSTGEYTESDTIRWVAEIQDEQLASRGLEFESLWGRPLQLIDIQNLFCETDKYARVAHPEYSGRTGRNRIKQKFTPSGLIPRPWFPPKWGINEKITEELPTNPPVATVKQRPLFGVEEQPATSILS